VKSVSGKVNNITTKYAIFYARLVTKDNWIRLQNKLNAKCANAEPRAERRAERGHDNTSFSTQYRRIAFQINGKCLLVKLGHAVREANYVCEIDMPSLSTICY